MAPDAIAHRVACVALAAAIAGLAPQVGAQAPYPRDPRVNPQPVQGAAPQDPASVKTQDVTGADPQGAVSDQQGHDAETPVEGVFRNPSSARPAPAPWRIVPRFSVAETYSDNMARTPSALARSGWLTGLSPGVRVEGGGGRVRGFLDYQFNDFRYSNQSQLNNTQNALNSQVSVEAIQDWLFVDARALVVQLNRSAFGASTPEVTGANTNRVETSLFSLSPYVRGAISDVALYQIRYNGTTSRTSGGVIPETTTSEWVGRVKNAPSASPLGWSADGSSLTLRSSSAGSKDNSRIRGSLMYALYPELHLSIYEGIESTDFAGPATQRNVTSAIGIEWTPGARTQVAAVAEKRFFGTGHNVLLSHRTPLMAFRFSDDKDISMLPGQLASGGQGSISGMLNDLLASSVPDPVARAEAVRTRLERTGTSDGSSSASAFLTTGVTLVQRREASATLLGRTNTVAFTWYQREFRALGGSQLGLVANTTATQGLSQQGYSASWAHQMTPRSSITLLDTYIETKDLNATGVSSKLHSQNLIYLTQLGQKTSVSFGGRRARFDSSTVASYRENALLVTASRRF